jgi:hypothetical protein
MAEIKPKPNSSLRTPKPKKLGLSVPPALRLPHEDLIFRQGEGEEREVLSFIREAGGIPSHTSPASMTSSTGEARHTSQSSESTELRKPEVHETTGHPAIEGKSGPDLTATPTSQTSTARRTGNSSQATTTSQTGSSGLDAITQAAIAAEYQATKSDTGIGTERESTGSQPSPTSHTSQTGQTTLPSTTTPTTQPSDTVMPVAPMRDFMKVANSIGRQAVPAGLFTGKSKQLYDCLYSMTRGAIVASRTVRISRPKLMKKAFIGSRVTFDANISRLLSVGLITVKQIPGEHEGNEYTIYLPEEIGNALTGHTGQTSHTTPTSMGTPSSSTSYAHNLGSPDSLENSHTRPGANDAESALYNAPKTFFKTINTIDDEVFGELTTALKTAVVRIQGSPPAATPAEKNQWGLLGEVLIAELLEAAGRSQMISSVPAFFAEHLRRRFSRPAGDPTGRYTESSTSTEPAPVTENRTPVRLNPDQITQSAEMLAELLARGEYTVASITSQFSAGFNAEDWSAILERAVQMDRDRSEN